MPTEQQINSLFRRPLFTLDGEPVKRTPWDYPYSFERFCTWKGDEYEKTKHSVYSDRMLEWDSKKFNAACQAVWGNHGQCFDGRTPGEIQRFLSLYFGHDVVLTGIEKACNWANGYPCWIFCYYDKEAERND